jgi:hypothetical protein
VFATSNTLASHVKKFHLETRNKINFDVVHESIFDPDCGQSHWYDALAFLESLPLQPPPFRQKNVTFATSMKRKLRFPFNKNQHEYRCKCGKRVDAWGDHSLGCSRNNKTATSNAHRDSLFDIFKRLLPVAKLIQSTGQVKKEVHSIVRSLPTLKPFDVSIRLDLLLSDGAWRTPFACLGFDITLVHCTKPLSLTPSTDEIAPSNSNENSLPLHLRKGESDKCARRTGGTLVAIYQVNSINYQYFPIYLILAWGWVICCYRSKISGHFDFYTLTRLR